jgi:hypothetical protein
MTAARYGCIPATLTMLPGSVAQAPTACTNRSLKPCPGAFHNWLLLSNRAVDSALCFSSCPTAGYRSIRTLPCLRTMCQANRYALDNYLIVTAELWTVASCSLCGLHEDECRSGVARIFIKLKRVENTVGLSVPRSQVHDDLKSARSRKLVRKSEDRSFNRFNGQKSVAEMQIEMDSGTG